MKKWKGRFSKRFTSRFDEIVFEAGKDQLTRREASKIVETGSLRALMNLSEAIQRFKPKSVRDLAHRMDLDQLSGIDGIHEGAIFIWGIVLDHFEGDFTADDWIDTDIKVSTLCVKKSRRRRFMRRLRRKR